jgi:hypothetical protein
MYYSTIKRPNPFIYRKNKGYEVGVIQPKVLPHVEQLM